MDCQTTSRKCDQPAFDRVLCGQVITDRYTPSPMMAKTKCNEEVILVSGESSLARRSDLVSI